ncbi:grasp-with-spasm system SPASM domain peptide maturase [Yeosuana marina]|uniref:grasp-with-spasm system SPASM domain peptide maturase n=1 Tax=Yeosuana marina TaxID=1565536 RepID=UPI00141F9CA6|nr:grasp-with-spasm system SPASM domain peptide maturase [Yeosuana marina]
MSSDNFILFSNCIPVKGANRSILCDTQNNKYYFIPNGLFEILENYNGKTIDFIKKEYKKLYDEVIDEYFEFLAKHNLIFFNSSPELFPKISLEWHSPSLITNMIIDYDELKHDLESILKQLEYLKCSHIQFRFFRETNLDFINSIVNLINFEKSRLIHIDFILPNYNEISKSELDILIKNNPRIHSIILYNSPRNISHKPIWNKMGYLMYVERNIIDEKHCGIINTEYFYSNIKLFSESQHYNTCLNRKISIDKEGFIKNCPSMCQSFGNIKNTTLHEVLENKDFKKYWNIVKDEIETCKDCEFRHVCTDCRAYLEEPNNKYAKPLKCGYSPYTNQWEEWSANPLKQKAIKYYEMQDLIKEND